MTSLRRTRVAGTVLALLAPGLTGCADSRAARPAPPVFAPSPGPPSADIRADGWVWESYRDLEVAVPPGWRNGTGDVAAEQWCISDTTSATPYVVRPGIAPEAPCPGPTPGEPNPATLIVKAGTFVSFTPAPSSATVVLGEAGDRTSKVIGSVLLRVQAEPDTRAKILDSARQITSDALGCPIADPISADPLRRPSPARKLSELREVTRVVACRYEFSGPAVPNANPAAGTAPRQVGPTLFSSLEITGERAARTVAAMVDTRLGGGPNDVPGCPTPLGIGTEAIVLRALSTSGVSQVYLRYGGCNGLDDGTDYRKLTRAAVAPFVSGPNAVAEFGESLGGILDDTEAPATSGDPL